MGMTIDEVNIHSWEDWCKHMNVIPKDQYKARLKADMVAMLTEIQLDIEEKSWGTRLDGLEPAVDMVDVNMIIQQKINALKGDQEHEAV